MTAILIPPLSMHVGSDHAEACPCASLTNAQRGEMLALLQEHFDGVSEAQFQTDLDAKDWALRISRGGTLVGFSTLKAYTTEYAGRAWNVIYSGDTVMSPEAWGSPVLARAWIALVRAIQSSTPGERWHWLLLSSGFRTYRFLPVFWREFWPRYDAEPNDETRDVMAALAREQFDGGYDAAAGVVRFPRPQRLKQHLAPVPEGRSQDPHVRFFLERNPGHAAGDELVCFASLGDDNLTAAGQRMVRGLSR